MKEIIAVDGYNLALQHGTGIATYARNLVKNVHEMGWHSQTLYGAPVSHKLPPLLREITLIDYLGGTSPRRSKLNGAQNYIYNTFASPFGCRATPIPLSGKVEISRFADRIPFESEVVNVENLFTTARQYFRQYKKFLKVRLDRPPSVMHWTYPLPVEVVGVPNIYTIHDLVPLRLPYTTLDNKKYYHRLISECLKTGHQICTVSEKSKTDIIEMFGVRESKITNTYQSVDAADVFLRKSMADAEREVEGIYGLKPQSYFLFFGAIEPKKNVARLVEAFLSAHTASHLVIVGAMAWKSDEEMKLLNGMLKRRPALGGRIHIFDYAPRQFLASLIRVAKAVVFPSLYEGFGLPILEAMQLGTPTLCSTGGSLPEIAGDASLIVDPYDVSSIARALRALDQDADLRQQLAERGRVRAQVFSSAAYRAKLLAMYQQVLGPACSIS